MPFCNHLRRHIENKDEKIRWTKNLIALRAQQPDKTVPAKDSEGM